MSPTALLPIVEKFPNVSREERDLLLDFARTTPLQYGAWKPFKLLFKKAEATLENAADVELVAALLHRIDDADFTQSSTRWKAIEAQPIVEQRYGNSKVERVTHRGLEYIVSGRTPWDYAGWRLTVRSLENAAQNEGVIAKLRRALGVSEVKKADANVESGSVIAFDFDSRSYIYSIKSAKIKGETLQINCGSTWNKDQDKTFVVDISDPSFIHLREAGPKTPTLQYMKRRARRISRHLSTRNPELYFQIALQLLHERGDKSLDFALNWAEVDVLFANSARWNQAQPGRGAYKKIAGKFVLKRREERSPEIWDAHLSQVRELFASQNVPIEANETALKVLRAHGETEFRVLEGAQLQRFLHSDSPLLQSVATRVFADAWRSGQTIDGATWANLFLLGNARTRRILNETPRENGAQWNENAAQFLGGTLENRVGTKKRRAAQLLIQRFENSISDAVFWKNIETFADVNEYSKSWVLRRIGDESRAGNFARLGEISRLRLDLRDAAMLSFGAAAVDAKPSAEQALPLVAGNDLAANAVGWQFLAATAIEKQTIRNLWYRVWDSKAFFAPAMHGVAATSDGALRLFERADFSSDKLASWLPKVPAFVSQLSPAFFAAIFGRVTPQMQIDLALTANDAQWQAARATLLRTLQNPDFLGTLQNPDLVDAFWIRVLERVSLGADEALQKRLLDDEEIAATFVYVTSSAVAEMLTNTSAETEPFLLRWLDAHIAQLSRSDSALLVIATHAFSEIRRRGLTRIREVGLDLPLALRLLESGLPEPFAVARAWFEMNEKIDIADRALALCDSPEASVRSFGREFLQANRDRVLDAKLLKKLSENSDSVMQAWLAEHLLQDAKNGGENVEVAAFDQAVLRVRGKSRRAKEAVKVRRDLSKLAVSNRSANATSASANSENAQIEYSNDDVAALLDVARGRTTRDREWALQQLAQLVLSGREIDGVSVGENISAEH